jgi:phage terminase large subunit-like protein
MAMNPLAPNSNSNSDADINVKLTSEFDIEHLKQPSPYCRCHPDRGEAECRDSPVLGKCEYTDAEIFNGEPFVECERCGGIVWQTRTRHITMSSGEQFEFPALHPGQESFRDVVLNKRFTMGMCGRRFGKSHLMLFMLVEKALTHDGSHSAWIAPNYGHAVKVAWSPLQIMIGKLRTKDDKPLFKFNKNEMTITCLANDSKIYFLLSEAPRGIHGLALDFVVIDEAEEAPENLWMDENTGESYVQPATSDTLGKVVMIGYPMGTNWWTNLFFEAKHKMLGISDSDDADQWGAIHASSWQNPLFPLSEKKRVLGGSLPEALVKNQYLAIPSVGGVGIFPHLTLRTAEDDKGVLILHQKVIKYEPPYYMGIDLGRERDYTVVTLLDRNGQLAYIDRYHKMGWDAIIQRFLGAWNEFGRPHFIIDASAAGNPVVDTLKHYHGMTSQMHPITMHSTEVRSALIEAIGFACDKGLLTIPLDLKWSSVLIDEMSSMKIELKDGKTRYIPTKGGHDDCIVSLCLAWKMLTRKEIVFQSFDPSLIAETAVHGTSLLAQKREIQIGYGRSGRRRYGHRGMIRSGKIGQPSKRNLRSVPRYLRTK